MSRTNFTGPISQGDQTGLASTQTIAYVPVIRQVALSQAASRQVITIPPNSTILRFGAFPTSGFTGDKAYDINVNFGSSADANQYGQLQIGTKTTAGYAPNAVLQVKQVSVGFNAGFNGTQGRVTLPPHSTLIGIGAIQTSALTGTDSATAAKVSFGTETDIDQYGIVVDVSALQGLSFVSPVSGALDFDSGGTIVVSHSAESTSVTTGGGARAFVQYMEVNNEAGSSMTPGVSAANFDSGGTIVVTLSAAGTTTFTGGGARAFVEYLPVGVE